MVTQHKPIARVQCPFCSKSFGQEVAFARHTESFHDTVADEALYVRVRLNGVRPTCQCSPDCAEPILWKGWKKGYLSMYVRGHNARVYTAFSDPVVAKSNAEKRRKGYAEGRYKPWNVGLTKETDVRMAKVAEHNSVVMKEQHVSGHLRQWNEGLSKETDPRVAQAAAMCHDRHESGELSVWNKGLSKDTDERVARYAKSLVGHAPNNSLSPDELALRLASLSDRFDVMSDPRDFKGVHVPLEWRCKKCGREQSKTLHHIEGCAHGCSFCHPRGSAGQSELFDFVHGLALDAVMNERAVIPPRELDVWIPSRRLGIEYDGLHYHSAPVLAQRGENPLSYHRDKLAACTAASVSFFSVFEDEWRDHRSIVEGMLRSRLGLVTDTLDARKLSVKALDRKAARAFFEANHLEGHAQSSHYIGLVEADGSVAAAVTLRRPFHRRYADAYELGRSCCRQGVNVRGWLGKLTAAAVGLARDDGKLRLVSYVDSRVGLGSSYEKAGWALVRADTGPRFWWTDGVTRMNRFACKADKSRGMTQAQVAEELGVVPIHGCPNSLWSISV